MDNPEFFHCNAQHTPEKQQRQSSDPTTADHFLIDDLLDFPNDDGDDIDAPLDTTAATAGTSTDTSCDSGTTEPNKLPSGSGDLGASRDFADGQFSSEFCVPYDDVAELEWLSNFVEESFSSNDIQKMHFISEESFSNKKNEEPEASPMIRPEMKSVPAKARSKRSRAAPCSWASRLLVVSSPPSSTMSSSSESGIGPSSNGKKTIKAPKKKPEIFDHSFNNNNNNSGGEGRKCLHCATDKTPQWRTGPLGPKTLCNACGVRYKSGRLVPEYRPAASPTFMLTKHSNSHRKVLELRRQKEVARAQQHQEQFLHHQSMVFDHASSNGDDYLIHQHIGPDFRQLI